jgi:hypothetical protein
MERFKQETKQAVVQRKKSGASEDYFAVTPGMKSWNDAAGMKSWADAKNKAPLIVTQG